MPAGFADLCVPSHLSGSLPLTNPNRIWIQLPPSMNAAAGINNGAVASTATATATAIDDEAALQNQKNLKSEEYRQLFHLPPEESLIADFNCALQKKILLQGHMYLFERYVCFYSNIFGYEKKKIVPLKDVTCVRKARTASVFPNAIEIVSWGKKHFFASFLSRDEAFRLIIDGWVQHSSHAKLFLHSQGSLASLAMSPQSRTSGAEFGAISQSALTSPLLMTRLDTAGNYESRVEEMAAKLAASAETAENGGPVENGASSHATDEPDGRERLVEDEGTLSSVSSSVGLQQSPLWEIEDTDAPPLPETYKTVVEAEFPVDVEEFFQLFFSNEGIGFAKDFHTKCGDDDFRCTEWVKHRQFGHARDTSFRHPINFYFGPKSTYCHEAQRFRVFRNCHMVLDTSQQMTDIPYGDYFQVQVRWDVERLYGDVHCHSFVRVSIEVSFSKKTMWKSKIEQGTYDESKEAYATWIQLAQNVIREMKSSPAHHQEGTVPEASITEIEVPPTDCPWSNEHTDRENEVAPTGCPWSNEPTDRANEVPSGTTCQEPQNLNNINNNVHTNNNNNNNNNRVQQISQGQLLFPSQAEWPMKVSSALKNGAWQKLSSLDWSAGKRHMKLALFMLFAVIIVSMQVGIIITLMWPQTVEPNPVAYQGNPAPTVGTCYGISEGDETLGWLERRVHHIKEEIAMTELRLQDLHQDLQSLKSHADRFQRHLSQAMVECRTTTTQTATNGL